MRTLRQHPRSAVRSCSLIPASRQTIERVVELVVKGVLFIDVRPLGVHPGGAFTHKGRGLSGQYRRHELGEEWFVNCVGAQRNRGSHYD